MAMATDRHRLHSHFDCYYSPDKEEEATKGRVCSSDSWPTLVVLGIIFGDDPLIGYSFIGFGVLVSIISAIISKRMKQRPAN